MKKSVWFFCQLLIAGGSVTQQLSMTSTEAQAHLDDLRKSEATKRAYGIELEGAML